MNNKFKGYIAGAVAAATYGMNPLFALPLYANGMDANSVLFFRYLCAIPIVGTMLCVRGHSFSINKRELCLLIALGVLFAFSSLSLFESYNHMGAGIASTLLFIYPILVALIMKMFFREPLSKLTTMCIFMSVVGIALLYRNANGDTLSMIGTMLVFTSALTYAIYIVSTNRSCIKEMPTLKITFYVLLFGWTVFATRTLIYGEVITPHSVTMWSNVLALALFPTAISLLCTTRAINLIGATPTAILGALEPVTAVFFGIVVFGETLSLREVFGLVLIIVAVSFVVAGGLIGQYLTRIRKMFPRVLRNK